MSGSGTPPPFSVEQTRELQQYLIRAGHDVGGADGKLGTSTRQAVRAMQIKFGLPADSYPTVELLTRLQVIGLADERSFRMPLTQELIGDALGLSVPHVNRTLRQLRDDELVSIEEHIVIIKDVEALSALADFERSYLDQFRLPEMIAKC